MDGKRRFAFSACLAELAVAFASTCFVAAAGAGGSTCRVESGATILPHVELYTSEGCDSCPAADAWLSRTFEANGGGGARAAVLAFHVDYWDRLGWRDRFARPEFTTRQRRLAQARESQLVYTPQVLVGGRDRGLWRNALAGDALSRLGREPSQARLTVAARSEPGAVVVDVEAKLAGPGSPDAALVVALTEDALGSAVSAGENAGRRLVHDHVVRAFNDELRFDRAGLARGTVRLAVPSERGKHPVVIAFAENRRTGDVLQSAVLDACLAP